MRNIKAKLKEEKLFIEKWHLVEDVEPSTSEAIFFVDNTGDLHVGIYNDEVHAVAMADGFGVKIEDVVQWMYVGSNREFVKYPEDGETVTVEVAELGTLALGMYTDRYINERGDKIKAVILESCYQFENVEGEIVIDWEAILSWYHVPEITPLRAVEKEDIDSLLMLEPEVENSDEVDTNEAPAEFRDEIQEAPVATSEIAQAAIPKEPPISEEDDMRESKIKEARATSFGRALAKRQDELNKITSKEALINFVKETCEPQVNDAEQETYLKNLLKDLEKKPFAAGITQVYNVILKGEKLGVIKEATVKNVKYAIYCNGITKDGFDPGYEGYVTEQENVSDPEYLTSEDVFDTYEEAEEYLNSGAFDASIEYDGVQYIIRALNNFFPEDDLQESSLGDAEEAVIQAKEDNEACDTFAVEKDLKSAEKSIRQARSEFQEAIDITDKDWMRMANLIAKNNNGATVADKITDFKKAAARYVTGMKLLEPTETFSNLDHMNDFFTAFYRKALDLNSSASTIRDMQSAFDNAIIPDMYKNVQLGDKQKFVSDVETTGPKIRKSMLVQPGLIERAPQYDFSDDGNYFRGYLYKDILPISALGADGDVYYTIRLDYLDIPYAERKEDMNLADEFNGVPKSDFDGEKFVQNCEYLYKKYIEPRKDEIIARQVFSLERAELAKAQRARWEKTNRWNRKYAGWEKDYAERSFRLEDFRNSPEYQDFLNLVKSKGFMSNPTKRAVLDLEANLKRTDLEKANMRKPQPHLPGLEDFNGEFEGVDFS